MTRAKLASPLSALTVEMALDAADALLGPVEHIAIGAAAGRIAAEMIAPAPPGVPRLVPGQRITDAHVALLIANVTAGAFFLDPIDLDQRTIRVVSIDR